jgi:predicted rRNA methylase YqxC with S4 and FtsJ domains
MTAFDIGTSNGGAALELERRGAQRVVAVDI